MNSIPNLKLNTQTQYESRLFPLEDQFFATLDNYFRQYSNYADFLNNAKGKEQDLDARSIEESRYQELKVQEAAALTNLLKLAERQESYNWANPKAQFGAGDILPSHDSTGNFTLQAIITNLAGEHVGELPRGLAACNIYNNYSEQLQKPLIALAQINKLITNGLGFQTRKLFEHFQKFLSLYVEALSDKILMLIRREDFKRAFILRLDKELQTMGLSIKDNLTSLRNRVFNLLS